MPDSVPSDNVPSVIGRFLGLKDAHRLILWIARPAIAAGQSEEILVTLHPGSANAPASDRKTIIVTPEDLNTGSVVLDNLATNTKYFYRLWKGESEPLELAGLEPSDLHFTTLP